jgi:MinD-like ATPase involved in chromosome partitioning or flagellar assembly
LLIVLNAVRDIQKILKDSLDKNIIIDYRIILRLNTEIGVYVRVKDSFAGKLEELENYEKAVLEIEYICDTDARTDSYYKRLFSSDTRTDLEIRRHLSNVIQYDRDTARSDAPIITFYSYKGGVGRTTALALFAAYYAIHHKKKVFIMDCDFEAPGMANFYNLDALSLSKPGIVEYILDKQTTGEPPDLRQKYVIEVGREYCGDGAIYVMPAGSLYGEDDRDDYLEGLARIDIHGISGARKQFEELIGDINKEFEPDVILIDSRTGFNDIFGLTVYQLSRAVVGFFGNDIQTKPGLHFFLKTILNKKEKTDTLIVNSIIPNTHSYHEITEEFSEEINSFINTTKQDDKDIFLDVFGIMRELRLENIGTRYETREDLIDFVKNISGSYKKLFEKIVSLIEFYNPPEVSRAEHAEKEMGRDIGSLRKKILEELSQDDNFSAKYAEDTKFDEYDGASLESKFYFRECMENIFNFDKFLILGGKGTGKTAIYKALKNELFVEKLKNRSRKEHLDFTVIDIISIKTDPPDKRNKYFEIAAQFDEKSLMEKDERFYNRFWITYIWNAVMLCSDKTGFSTDTEFREIKNDSLTTAYFKDIISDDLKFARIEQELYRLDSFLKKNQKHLLIIFDQLDYVVKPVLWSKIVSPLINLCRSNNFSRIFPKLFLRRDLFNKISGITNKEHLREQAVNLEWSKEEIFGFFFKIIFSKNRDAFFEIMKMYKDVTPQHINEIKTCLEENLNQTPLEEFYIKPLVETFFGKYADGKSPRFGETYDWFYKNLKNADGTISLRPFLDLVGEAIGKFFNNPWKEDKPILASLYFGTASTRKQAVQRHFEDLAQEEGNEYLKIAIEYIRDSNAIPPELRKINLSADEFYRLTDMVLKNAKGLEHADREDLTETMISNGIVKVRYKRGGARFFSFAFLYKYYLGLSGN